MTAFTYHKLLKHIIPWLIVAVYFYFNNSVTGSKISVIGFVILFTSNLILTYYLLIHLGNSSTAKKKQVLIVLAFMLSYIFYLSLDLINFKLLFPLISLKTLRDEIQIIEFIHRGIKWYFYIAIVAYANIKSKSSINNVRDTIKRKEALLSRQLNILKHQFHSHLNYNFINYCYGLILKVSRPKAEIVSYYSDMLVYALKTHSIKKGPIKQEIEYLKQFVNFQSYFLNQSYHTSEINTDSIDYEITPLLLGTLLEQAYKHAQLGNNYPPLKSLLTIQKGQLLFSISFAKSTLSSAVIDFDVMEQLKDFLLLRYPKNHELDFNITADLIHLKLKLNLHV